MKAGELRQYLDNFLKSPVVNQARVQIEMPNGIRLDVCEIQLLESKVQYGGTWKMGKVIKKL
jgi:hypothetical protein